MIEKGTIFLVDDDPSVRRGLTRLIRSAGHPVEAFASAREFLDAFPRGSDPACLVLDVRMPGITGLDLQQELQKTKTVLPIIFITGHGNIPTSVKAMKDGAVDFLEKPVQDTELLRSIQQALVRGARDRAERAELENIQSRAQTLTPREREVMELVTKGLFNKQIAGELGTVEKTIKVHRARVMRKMQVKSLADLVRLTAHGGIGKA